MRMKLNKQIKKISDNSTSREQWRLNKKRLSNLTQAEFLPFEPRSAHETWESGMEDALYELQVDFLRFHNAQGNFWSNKNDTFQKHNIQNQWPKFLSPR